MADTFQDFITRDRERLHAEREAIFNQQHELEGKLAAINNELRAIDAYEAAKSGKPASTRQTGTRRAPQARSGTKREQLLQVIKDGHGPHPRRDSRKDGAQGRQDGRDVGIERPHRAHQGQPGGAAGRQIRRRLIASE